ncbi:hypothetical protein N5D45_13390 [Stenotrophomonas sp. GD03819]|uniref:hypothetical protein n=1 Tax=Stenotrophomonas sp. GD03819 TaxID=2975384 RepID=UPI002446ED1B|nr:hypothetical protein [Stenotrophomonas sp. GD03819]MDH1792814.1 hypothetical protein [Stenotrophomonas sp. GD03819]
MKSARKKQTEVDELSLDDFGICFESDDWVLQRTVLDGVVECLRMDLSRVPDGWRLPVKRYLARVILGRVPRSSRYAHVILERFLVLRQFAQWCSSEGARTPNDLSADMILPWVAASQEVGRKAAGAKRTRAKFLNVEDFLLDAAIDSKTLRAEIIRVGRRLAKASSLEEKNRSLPIDAAEADYLALLADAIILVEQDGEAVVGFLQHALASEVGRVNSAGGRSASFYEAKRALPFEGFKSKALRHLDPRVGYGEQNMLQIAEGAAVFIICMLSSMRPSEVRRVTTKSVRSGGAHHDSGDGRVPDVIEGVLSKSRRQHEWISAPAVSDALNFLERLGRPIREEVGTTALFVLGMYRGRARAEARGDERIARVDSYAGLRTSMRVFAKASLPEFDSEKIQFRPLRRFLARFIARRDRTSLGALAYQYGHLEARITDTYYVGLDRDLSLLLDEEQANEVVSAMDDLVNAEAVFTNLPEQVMASSLLRMSDVLDRASTNREVMQMLGSGVVLGPCDWGYCFYRENRSRCEGNAMGPNAAKRTPGTCAGCLNFTATAKHAPWWELRRQDLKEFLKLRGIPEQSRLIAEGRLSSAELILKKIKGGS